MDTSRVDGVKDAANRVVADVAFARVDLLDDVDTGVAEDAEDLAEHARAVLIHHTDSLDRVQSCR